MSSHLPQRLPRTSRARVDGCFHVHTQQGSLRQNTRGKMVAFECGKPAMDAVMMDMRVDNEGYQNVGVKQPGHCLSSPASIRRRVSAVMGRLPRETTNWIRLTDRPRPSFGGALCKGRISTSFTDAL